VTSRDLAPTHRAVTTDRHGIQLPIVQAPDGLTQVAATDAAPGRPDLQDEDLYDLLVGFYARIADDARLAPYFAGLEMSAHMPRIVDFWSTLLFHTGRYTGNAFRPHEAMPGLTADHFARWVDALETEVDSRADGANAARMKALAHRVAYSMQLRLGLLPFTPWVSDVDLYDLR
jgi:hemoglobin